MIVSAYNEGKNNAKVIEDLRSIGLDMDILIISGGVGRRHLPSGSVG